MNTPIRCLILLLFVSGSSLTFGQDQETKRETTSILRRKNLVAWCIVPFDASRRGPAERAQMLKELGVKRCAYDWRAEHVPTFEQEILEYKKHGIEFFAFWSVHEDAFKLFNKHNLHPQIWRTLGDPGGENQADKIEVAAQQQVALATRTKEMGCKLGLYNHGGWGGEPQNLVAVCKRLHELGHEHVGIVYNFHHGHEHIECWAESLKLMLPYLHCLNLNGMNDGAQPKILGIGKGACEQKMIREIVNSGYEGPIGILDHRSDLDARDSLRENRDGLEWIRKEIEEPGSGGSKPVTPKSAVPKPTKETSSVDRGHVLPGADHYRRPPITVEVRATLHRRDQYNIFVASDTKKSKDHWELFSMNGSGRLSVYMPGQQPDHVQSNVNVCNGKPHTLTMIYEANQVKLFVDGRKVANQSMKNRDGKASVPGSLSIGRLVKGGLGCSGTIDWVRISKGVRKVSIQPVASVSRDAATIGLWQFPPTDQKGKHSRHGSMTSPPKELPCSAELVATLADDSQKYGNTTRDAVVFSNAPLVLKQAISIC